MFGQADWFAFGRLAWDPTLNAMDIHKEWAKLTFTKKKEGFNVITDLLDHSHETVVKYMTPLGLHHIMAAGQNLTLSTIK